MAFNELKQDFENNLNEEFNCFVATGVPITVEEDPDYIQWILDNSKDERMIKLIDEGYGKEKSIPQLILAGASVDDVFVIVLFSTLVNIAAGTATGLGQLINVPVAILSGIVAGIITGAVITYYFEYCFQKKKHIFCYFLIFYYYSYCTYIFRVI